MKNKILIKFIVSYFSSLGTFILMDYFNLVDMRIMDGVVLSFIISFCVTMFMLNKKVNKNRELNVKKLKNEYRV